MTHMKIIKKSEEHIRKQIEWFVNKDTEVSPEEKKNILENAWKIAQIGDFNNIPENLQNLIDHHKGRYIDVLRSEKRQEYWRKKTDRIFDKLAICPHISFN